MKKSRLTVSPGTDVLLKNFPTLDMRLLDDPRRLKEDIARHLAELSRFRETIVASRNHSLLIVVAGMDAAGKDSLIKHAFSPIGCRVESFKIESFWALAQKEAQRDFLARFEEKLPEQGEACAFNRSYYEHLTLDRVHPKMLDLQHIPEESRDGLWERRCAEINQFEKGLIRRGCIVVKVFLHISKDTQRRRFLRRINLPEKRYKFDPRNDMDARARWADYTKAFEYALSKTNTANAPWLVVPADAKLAAQAIVLNFVCAKLRRCGLRFPSLTGKRKRQFLLAKRKLELE